MAKSKIAACVLNDQGDLLPYTCQSTKSQVEEWAAENLLAWDKLKELGCKIVQVEIKVVEPE